MPNQLIEMTGFGGEVALALSIGTVAWDLVKRLQLGRTAGGVPASGVQMAAFAIDVLAIRIWREWWDPNLDSLVDDALALLNRALWSVAEVTTQLTDLGSI